MFVFLFFPHNMIASKCKGIERHTQVDPWELQRLSIYDRQVGKKRCLHERQDYALLPHTGLLKLKVLLASTLYFTVTFKHLELS